MDHDALQQQTMKLRERILRFVGVASHINARPDLYAVMRATLEYACELTGASCGLIGAVNDAGEADYLATCGFAQEEDERLLRSPGGPKLIEYFPDLRGVHTFEDLPPATQKLFTSLGLERAQSFLCTPLHHQDQRVGSFVLMRKKDEGDFTKEDEEILASFERLATTAIASTRTHRHERRARVNLEALLDAVPVGVVVFDARVGNLEFANHEAKQLLRELQRSTNSDETLLNNIKGRRTDGQAFSLREALLAQQISNAETVRGEVIEFSVDNGRCIYVLLSGTSFESLDGVGKSVVVTMQDLTTLHELELTQAKVISMVSHELRTPLTSIKVLAETLLSSANTLDPAEILQYVRSIDTQAEQMRDLVSDLLDIGLIKTGTLSIDPEPWNISSILDRARNMFLSGCGTHSIIIDLPSSLPQVMVDSLRIVQVLTNLFANAVKYAPTEVPIRVTAERADSHIAVSVTDYGIGIPKQLLPQLFQTHMELGDKSRNGLRGAGLGLAICKGLVEAHGGRIEAFSDGDGNGTRVMFTLPIARGPDSSVLISTNDSRIGSPFTEPGLTRILIADDDPDMCRHIRNALTLEGYDSIVTTSSKSIPSIIRESKPHLVVLDLMLPDTDGIALLDSVPELNDIPVIIISGYCKDEMIARALDAGAVDYIVKPFSSIELTARIRAVLRRNPELESFMLKDLAIHYEERRVTVSGRHVRLTATEYELLRLLSLKPGRVVDYSTIIRTIWSDRAYAHAGLVRSAIMKLRHKLGKNIGQPNYIVNEHGVGYRLAKSDEL